ncbi:uncharacterized protein PV09_05896 [Verruconis gallopava]|uniref:Zn(2)-C6 fungal-type domain-containing protein n=1 Tax=Verruconis gallopava TaxID=253628 RepID=A0A0D2AUL1_9PEZI|nr:uncharacterized protein PV09_05896 [Verruconis gallopava]KIW02839.1 hypothetical protein PV09_05896 [Verruconis gallopava]
MSRLLKGCQQCRNRKVKCDRRTGGCRRCETRGEPCSGYSVEGAFIFKSETQKVEQKLQSQSKVNGPLPKATCSRMLTWRTPAGPCSNTTPFEFSISSNTPESLRKELGTDNPEVWRFFDRFVMYPCNSGSSRGFLEHLPSLFMEPNITHRYALRYAVLAVAYASATDGTNGKERKQMAFHFYGLGLSALSKSLEDDITESSDYVLMTVVVLDIFESLYCDNPSTIDSHVQGMRNILRLRGSHGEYDPKGWSLLRLSHHRMKRHELARGLPPMPDSTQWLDNLDEGDPFVDIEKRNSKINEVCEKARQCLRNVNNDGLDALTIVSVIREMHTLDQLAVNWHEKPHWKFTTISREDVECTPELFALLPETLQLHSDAWMAYEWNYHRTARILMHCQLLKCLDRLDRLKNHTVNCEVNELRAYSLSTVRHLTDEILSTVPQSLGDITNKGKPIKSTTSPKGKAVGGYFLLWPTKVIKNLDIITPHQAMYAELTFERIREHTGMKSALTDLRQD